MNCPKCGAENESTARFCRDCGEIFVQQSPTGEPAAPPPQDGAQQPPVQPQQPQGGYYQQPPQGAYYQQPSVGAPVPPQGPRPVFNTTAAICAIIFGFLCGGWIGGIFGVLALVKGNKVDNLYAMGDYQGAMNAAAEGKKFLTLSWVLSAIGFVLGGLSLSFNLF